MTELELESTSMSENWEEWCCRTDNKYNSIYIVRHFPNWIMFPSQEDKKANRNSQEYWGKIKQIREFLVERSYTDYNLIYVTFDMQAQLFKNLGKKPELKTNFN